MSRPQTGTGGWGECQRKHKSWMPWWSVCWGTFGKNSFQLRDRMAILRHSNEKCTSANMFLSYSYGATGREFWWPDTFKANDVVMNQNYDNLHKLEILFLLRLHWASGTRLFPSLSASSLEFLTRGCDAERDLWRERRRRAVSLRVWRRRHRLLAGGERKWRHSPT